MSFSEKSLITLELPAVLDMLSHEAVSDAAKERALALTPSADAAEVKRRNSRTIVHVDAVQAWMRVPIKLDNIDTLAVSGHKIHAPKGIAFARGSRRRAEYARAYGHCARAPVRAARARLYRR